MNNCRWFPETIEEAYIRTINDITLKKYTVKQIRELIFTIHILLKIEPPNCRNVTIRFTKFSSSNKIKRNINRLDDIYEIIQELIKMDHQINKTRTDLYRYINFH